MCSMSYISKVVISGDILEFYNYSVPILEGYIEKKKGSSGRQAIADEKDKKINREKVLSRARRDLRRLINTNIRDISKFMTLTFADNIQDFDVANYEFKKFIQRLSYELHTKVEYVCVPEFQKRGAIHYHVLMFNVPYIASKRLRELWGQGFIRINKIDSVTNVGAYICKYMQKDFDTDDRLMGKKCYFSSRKLEKPVVIKDKDLVKSVEDSMQSQLPTYENTFKNDYNTTQYRQYNMKNTK